MTEATGQNSGFWSCTKTLIAPAVIVSLWWYYKRVKKTDDSLEKKLDDKVSNTGEKKYNTNWCDMPPEIKLKCIETMDFEMRCQLRQSARAENQLVDSLKYKFKLLDFCDAHVTCRPKDHREQRYYIKKNCNFWIPYILNHCEVDQIKIGLHDLSKQIDFANLDTVLKPKSISCDFYEYDINDFNIICQFFKKCWNQVENIKVAAADDFPFDKFFAIPSVFNAKILYIDNNYRDFDSTSLIPLIEKWIEIDAPVGTKFSISYCREFDFELLFDHFQSSVISLQELMMRMKTDNPKKHIRMYLTDLNDPSFFIRVISSDMK